MSPLSLLVYLLVYTLTSGQSPSLTMRHVFYLQVHRMFLLEKLFGIKKNFSQAMNLRLFGLTPFLRIRFALLGKNT